ncbi:MAG: transposase [Bacteroidia bacterium]|nr:transposase [Bacteroidia bacterium]
MKHNRKHIRWRSWDYSSCGAYFVTICTEKRERYFGEIKTGLLNLDLEDPLSYLNAKLIAVKAFEFWKEIPLHYKFVQADCLVIMPDHIHGILYLDLPYKTEWKSNSFGPQRKNLPDIIRAYKGAVTKWANENLHAFKWQRSYYDRVIRNEEEYHRIKSYISENPNRWCKGSS